MKFLKDYLQADLARLAKPTWKNFLIQYFFPRGGTFRYIFWFRVMQCLKGNAFLKVLSMPVYLIFRHYEYKYGIHMNTNIPVGKGILIVHGGSVFVNCSKVGENVTIYQSVTLGTNIGETAIPVIEDDVTICTGAVCVGGITLGKACMVGANAFVNKTVEPGTIVAGIPAREIKKK